MSQSAIVLPAALQAVMSVLLLFLMGPARARSLRESKLTIEDHSVRLGINPWSDRAMQVSNNYKNQFELPVLFYAVVAFALVLKQADTIMIGLAWTFALSRLAHTAVHVSSNIVRWRAIFFVLGAIALLAMWLVLVWRIWNGA